MNAWHIIAVLKNMNMQQGKDLQQNVVASMLPEALKGWLSLNFGVKIVTK